MNILNKLRQWFGFRQKVFTVNGTTKLIKVADPGEPGFDEPAFILEFSPDADVSKLTELLGQHKWKITADN